MSAFTCRQTFDKLLKSVNTIEKEVISFRENHQNIINNFPDAISEFKSFLTRITSELDNISEDLIKLTWNKKPEGEYYTAYTELLETGENLYCLLNCLQGVAEEELINFKQSADNFHESLSDLKFIFADSCINVELSQLTTVLAKLF